MLASEIFNQNITEGSKYYEPTPSKAERQKQGRVPLRTLPELSQELGVDPMSVIRIANRVDDFPKPVPGISGRKKYYVPQQFLQWAKKHNIGKFGVTESKICPVCGCTPCNCTHIVKEDFDWREASAKSNLQPGVPVMIWLGPRNQNPPRDDKKWWERGVVMDRPEWIDGAWRVLVKTDTKSQWPINPERVFVLNQGVAEDSDPCWKGYKQIGMKDKAGKKVPNCVPEGTEVVPVINPEDTVSLDIPLLIRLLEYSREDAKTDMDLHNVAERLITLSAGGRTLSMNDYDTIIPGSPD